MNRAVIAIVSRVALAAGGCRSEQAKQIDRWVGALSWDSVVETGDYGGPHLELAGEPTEELIKIGKPATKQLIAALRDPEKAAAAHLVLCHVWYSEAEENCKSVSYDTPGAGARFQYGELRLNSASFQKKNLDREMLARVERSWRPFLEKEP